MVKRMLILVAVLASFSIVSFADIIEIPYGMNVKQFKKDAKKEGLDFYDKKDSFGFIENHGQEVVIKTYRSATKEDLTIIRRLVQKNVRD